MSGSEVRCSGAKYFLRVLVRQTSVLPALVLDLLSLLSYLERALLLERSKLSMHYGHRHASLRQWHHWQERRWEEIKKGKLESSRSQWRQDQAQMEGKPANTSTGWLQKDPSHCPAGSKSSVRRLVAVLPWCSHSHPGLGMKAPSGSCHSQHLTDLEGLGTEELRASRTGNQGIAVDTTCLIKPEALAEALPPVMHAIVPQSQWACREWE